MGGSVMPLALVVAALLAAVGIWGLLSGSRWWRRQRDTAVNLLVIAAAVIAMGLIMTVLL